jgi:prepilin-type N-terminal cleavage/methylation domain-containing protein
MRCLKSRGFTLVELLVVIAIIGVLVALLLPAVQSAREAGRRTQCNNNLKQLALAVLNYESAHRSFPPSSLWNVADGATPDIAASNKYSENWGILVLPFLEEQSLFDRFDHTRYITHPLNEPARSTPLSVMRCPTDTDNDQPFNGSATTELTLLNDRWARGNYAANASLGAMNSPSACDVVQGLPDCAAFPASAGWKLDPLRGIMGANIAVKMAQIRDGTSHTILLAEMRIGLNAADPRGVWALGGGASSLWGHGSYFWQENAGPNPQTWSGDNVASCASIATLAGCASWMNCPAMQMLGMGCYACCNNQTAARSAHAGGLFVALADGSVQFIGDFIDSNGDFSATPIVFSVWDRLNLSADGQILPGNSY